MTAGRKKQDALDRYDTPRADVLHFLRAWFQDMGTCHHPDELRRVWEPAAGSGSMVSALREALPEALIWASDLEPRGEGILRTDFLEHGEAGWDLIITNPPYRLAEQFVRHAHELVRPGGWVVMLLRAGFLEARSRRCFWQEFPPRQVFFLERRPRFTGPNSDGMKTDTAMYAWFVWQRAVARRYFEGYRI